MERLTHPMLHLIGLLAFLLPLQACSKQYSAEPIEAWVVDAGTKKPIEGVIVVANWELHKGTLAGRIPGGQLNVLETVTDKAGRFFFPGWGPKWAWRGYLDHEDPILLFYKQGYKYRGLGNPLRSDINHSVVRRSVWNGKTIELEKFKGGLGEYVRHLSFLMGGLRFIEDDCQWKKTPRMLMALQKQADTFEASGIVSDIYRVDYLPTDEKKCGSVKEHFRSYQQ